MINQVSLEEWWSYLAGLVAADGHIERDSSGFTIATSDREFLETMIRQTLSRLNIKASYFWDRGAKVFKAQVSNYEACTALQERFNIPPGKKARTIGPPPVMQQECVRRYVSGWFDGEGWVEESVKRYVDTVYRYPRIGFKITSKEMLRWMSRTLGENGIRVSEYARRDDTYGLWINGFRECARFQATFGFHHPRQVKRLHGLLAHRE